MEACDQVEAPAAFFSGTETPLPFRQEAGWAAEAIWTPVLEPGNLGPPAHSLMCTPTERSPFLPYVSVTTPEKI
jgi:hypothetical protein